MGGGGSSDQTVGYRYFLGLHLILCHGEIDAVTELRVDDRLAWSGTNTGGESTFLKAQLFGGEEREGGVGGTMVVDMGGTSQTQNSYLLSQIDSSVPSYRGVVGVILKGIASVEALFDSWSQNLEGGSGFYIGNNPYLKNFAFRAKRNTKRTDGQTPLVGVTMAIGDDMNPVSMIHECLTDSDWGMGYNYSDIDEASFVAVGTTLVSEGMGMSLTWDSQIALKDFIQEILKHIDGVLFVDVGTGLFTLKLIRSDYVVGDLPVLNEDNVQVIKEFNVPVIGELINSLTVKYWDKDTASEASLTLQDIALQLTQQETISTTFQYAGFTNGTIIAKVASRDLVSVSTPLISCDIYGTRELGDLSIGDAFVLEWPDYNVQEVVMRVVSIEFGSQGSSRVKIKASQDVYAAGDTVVAAPPVSEWVEYRSDPQTPLHPMMYEVPYWEIVMRGGQAEADSLGEFDTGFIAVASKPTPDALFANLLTNGINGYEQRTTLSFSGTAELLADISFLDITFGYENGINAINHLPQRYIQIDEELMNLVSIDDSTIVVERGVLDTIPAEHSVGARIYFNGGNGNSDGVTYQYHETASVKLLTVTGLGQLEEATAPVLSKTLNQYRQYRPYPPANVKINSVSYPATIVDTADITVTWNTRSRTQLTTAQLYAWTNGSNFGEEAGTTYTVQLLTLAGSVIVQQIDLSAVTTATFLLAEFSAHTDIRVKIWSTRDGHTCLQVFDHTFTRVPA